MRKLLLLLFLSLFITNPGFTQDQASDSANVKTGWTLGLLPTIAFDSDKGFQYGGLVNFYYFGDGSTYPNYKHSINMEISRFTKGSGINRFFYDSEHLFKKPIRLTFDISYLTDKALDFYGFNGKEGPYQRRWEDEAHPDYISRMFYRMDRDIFRAYADFQGPLKGKNLRWVAGMAIYNYKLAPVDLEKMNEGKDADDLIPDTAGLFEQFVRAGIIPEQEADGGNVNFIKAGLVYDTRDIEANPMKGIWTEIVFATAPRMLGNNETPFTKLAIIHRQYFTIVKDRLSFAGRLGWQSTIDGHAPFYFQPYLLSSFAPSVLPEGLGGAKSTRGILRNRIVGDEIAYGNLELRWKFLRTQYLKQNIYLALSGFLDGGKVLKSIPANYELLHFDVKKQKDPTHLAAGIGFHFALNENFVVSFDYGRSMAKSDGISGLYITTNWLF